MQIWHSLSGVIGGLCMGLIAVALTRLPRTPIRPRLYAFLAAGMLWAVGDLIAASAGDMTWKQIGVAIFYTGAIFLPAFWWAIALRWAEDVEAGLPFRAAAWERAPLVWAGAMWLVMVTNPWHGAFLTPVVGGRNLYEPLWYLMALPNYGLIVAALAVELEVARRIDRREVRRQASFLIAASGVTLICSGLYVSGQVELNATVVMLSLSSALLLMGMAREGLFGVVPAALSAIAAEHPDGLVVVGPDGRVRYANPRAHELLAPSALGPNRRVLEAFEKAELPRELEALRAPGADDRWWARLARPEGLSLRLDGEPRWLHLSATPVHGRGRGEHGYCLRISDDTGRKQAELQASQTRRLESVAALARTVSRDFQGVLAIVQGNAELLSAETERDGASQRKLGRIVEAARYGADMAHQLQLYTGSVDTSRVPLELTGIVEETCELVDSDLPAWVSLRYARPDRLLAVAADPIQIRHCIFSVLMNAVEATPETGGRIEVSTGECSLDPSSADELVSGREEPPGDFAYVRVRDQAGGMDAETQERAFEPFFSTRGKDRGNGLPTVLGIARAHDAPVGLVNEPGRGCTITLYFPLSRD